MLNRMEFIDCGTSDVLFIRSLVRQFIKSKVLDVEQSVVRPVSEVTRVSQLQTKTSRKSFIDYTLNPFHVRYVVFAVENGTR